MARKNQNNIYKETCALWDSCEINGCDGYGTLKKRAGVNKKGICPSYVTQNELNLIDKASGIEARV